MNSLTIVMYHYVRDVAQTPYPRLKALPIEAFEGQLDYVVKHYHVCRVEDVVAAVRGLHPLPPRACLLTFDDGLLDHFTVVLPRLAARGLPASFYPPAAAAEGGRVLDTHKIHFILASVPDHVKLARRLLDMIDTFRNTADIPSGEELYRQYAHPFWLDPPEVVFLKRVLQRGLPAAVRSTIVSALFEEYVAVAESTFARGLYMDVEHLRRLAESGMEIGGHGADHVWLDSLSPEDQAREIDRTRAFLTRIFGAPPADWVMSYPFGSYDGVTLELVARAGCQLGVTTRVGVARSLRRPLELPRLDTNELPRRGDAPLSRWTAEAAGGGP